MSLSHGALAAVLIAIAATSCRTAQPASVPAAPGPASLPSVEDEPTATAPDLGCRSNCLDAYPAAPDPGNYAAYCDELCVPATEVNTDCVSGCERSHEPGAYYDDDGEYRHNDDARTDDERAADGDACAAECAAVVTVSSDALAACVDACTADGGGDSRCAIDCDPDPYDECRYQPCD